MKASTLHLFQAHLIGALGLFLAGPLLAGAPLPDPFAGNNTLYPHPKEWQRRFRTSNFDYPATAVASTWKPGGPTGLLTRKNAAVYVAAVKQFIEKDMAGLLNEPLSWTPQRAGWYDMPWGGQGTTMPNNAIDPTSGREALLGSYTGQIIQPDSYRSNPPAAPFQNHAVVYYNDVAGAQLGKVWKNPFQPDPASAQFPEGSIVVKVESVTVTEQQWPVLQGSSVSYIYRPTVAAQAKQSDPTRLKAVKTPVRFLQMAVRIKDSVASPNTGWVFIAFAYDAQSKGATVWERAVPVGATWGNDPKQARFPAGVDPAVGLQETWVNDKVPSFITDGLGWGGRLAGPLDLGLRHNVVTVSGQRYSRAALNKPGSLASSSCVSCHSSAQYPFVTNLYPSPNMTFPAEGKEFLLFEPGSPMWAKWYQNRRGDQPMSGKDRAGIVGTDYDMMLTFALMRANGSADTDVFIRNRAAGH